jgi:hypothetical protein
MPLKVAAIVKNAENVDRALGFASTVNDEVPEILQILHKPKKQTWWRQS